jgi:hypothetical protein
VFDFTGATVTGASGGAADDVGFTVSSGASGTVLGFSLQGFFISAGSGVLTTLEISGDASSACMDNLIISGAAGVPLDATVSECLTVSIEAPCDDVDADDICDDIDDCVGVYDCADECNGNAVEDVCGVCGGNASDENGGCFIDLSIGSVADGSMEILINNTIPLTGFQFEISGVTLGDGAASGGIAGDAGFSVENNETGMILGFSMTGVELPAGQGVLTNVAYTAIDDEACITNEVLALGDWSGGFYEILIGDCAALDFNVPTTTLPVTYSSDTDISGFQFIVSGAALVNASGGAAEAAFVDENEIPSPKAASAAPPDAFTSAAPETIN